MKSQSVRRVYLDIDGCLNSHRSAIAFEGFPHPDESWYKFDPVAIALVRKLIHTYKCEVTLSSTWRLDAPRDPTFLKRLGDHFGFEIKDCTPNLPGVRGIEIDHHLKDNPCDIYIIIDDDSDMLEHQFPNFIKVDGSVGFSEENYYLAERILSRKSQEDSNE